WSLLTPSGLRSAVAHSGEIFFFLRSRLVSVETFLRMPAAFLRLRCWTFGSVELAASVMRSPARWICFAMDGATGVQTGGAKAPPSTKRQVRAEKPVAGV